MKTKLGEYLRSWHRYPYTLSLYSLGFDARQHKERLGYKLTCSLKTWPRVIFEGTDLFCSPCHAIDSDASAGACLGFLSLKPGDTDADYFDKYTPAQLDFVQYHGEDLSLWSMELEEKGA